MSRLWRVDGDALEVRAARDEARSDTFKVTLGERVLEVRARRAPDGTLTIAMPNGEQVRAVVSSDANQAGVRWISVGAETFVVKEAEAHGRR